MKFEHLFSPMQVGKVTYRNRIVSAPMAFGLIVQNPDARDFTYRKLEASAKGGNGYAHGYTVVVVAFTYGTVKLISTHNYHSVIGFRNVRTHSPKLAGHGFYSVGLFYF